MFNSLFVLDDIYLFLLISIFFIVISFIAIFIINKTIQFNIRRKDNPVVGNTVALITVIYGVLAGLSALYLINNNSYTADIVQREANSVADIWRQSNWIKEPARSQIHKQLKNYLNTVINVEWPLMSSNKIVASQSGNADIDAITEDLVKYDTNKYSEILFVKDILGDTKNLYDLRQQRILMSETMLSPELWVVIILGTILTLCMNFLFGMNFYFHLLSVTATCLMLSSMLFMLIALDRPFQGEFIIEPTAFQGLLSQYNEVKT
jgi:hypothetical protein